MSIFQWMQGRIHGGLLGSDEPPQTDAPWNQRYEMIDTSNKLKVFRKVYKQRRARSYEKSGFVFRL